MSSYQIGCQLADPIKQSVSATETPHSARPFGLHNRLFKAHLAPVHCRSHDARPHEASDACASALGARRPAPPPSPAPGSSNPLDSDDFSVLHCLKVAAAPETAPEVVALPFPCGHHLRSHASGARIGPNRAENAGKRTISRAHTG